MILMQCALLPLNVYITNWAYTHFVRSEDEHANQQLTNCMRTIDKCLVPVKL